MSHPATSGFPRFFHTLSLSIAVAIIAMGVGATSVKPIATSSDRTSITTTGEQTGDIQLADEIIRRLRRLGLNFNRARLPRPYDPAGDLC